HGEHTYVCTPALNALDSLTVSCESTDRARPSPVGATPEGLINLLTATQREGSRRTWRQKSARTSRPGGPC
ncbi:unnamed protein product, partial [Amoebophrya sp. A120]